jgi:hypothetical protein
MGAVALPLLCERITAHAAARDFEQVCVVLVGGSTADRELTD